MLHSTRVLPLVVAAGVAAMLGCSRLPCGTARPAGVPAQAFWLGGPDDGVFVQLNPHDGAAATSYSGSIYHSDGSIWYAGKFVLKPAGSRPIDPFDRAQFAGWDGTRILLQDGRSLLAANEKKGPNGPVIP